MIATLGPLIIALLASCGAGSPAPDAPNDKQPPTSDLEDQAFCCLDVGVNSSGQGTGEGCVTIGPGNIDACDKVLICGGSLIKEDGKVTCL